MLSPPTCSSPFSSNYGKISTPDLGIAASNFELLGVEWVLLPQYFFTYPWPIYLLGTLWQAVPHHNKYIYANDCTPH